MTLVTRPNTDTNWAEGGNTVEPSTEKQELGWTIEKPPNEMMNWIHNKQDKAVQYFLQEGISDWNSSQDYSNSSVVKYNKVVYKAKLASKGKQPDTETSVWEIAFSPYSVATDLDKVKNTVNYATKLVYKEAPVFTATATGTAYLAQTGAQVNKGYSFVGKTTDGLFHNTSPVILKNGVEVARFESVSNVNESNKKVVTMDVLQQYLQQYKVGDLYLTTSSDNPTTRLGYGTWVRYAQGSAIVGFSEIPSSPEWTRIPLNQYGQQNVTLTTNNLPKHTHDFPADDQLILAFDLTRSTGFQRSAYDAVSTLSTGYSSGWAETSGVGESLPFSVIQPSIVVFIWRRTA